MRRREFITLLGGAAPRGRSRRGRSSPSGCGASACSDLAADDPELPDPHGGVPARSAASWAGPTAATCGSTIAGARSDAADAFASTRRNWSRSRRTSFWPLAPRPWGRCCRRPAPCRSCSRTSPIRSAPVSSTALARPGGNVTGFMQFEYSLSGKWLELLKEIAPGVTRVGGPSGSQP